MGALLAIDTTAVETVLTDLQTAALPVVGTAVGVSAAVFAIMFVWRKARSAIS